MLGGGGYKLDIKMQMFLPFSIYLLWTLAGKHFAFFLHILTKNLFLKTIHTTKTKPVLFEILFRASLSKLRNCNRDFKWPSIYTVACSA